MGQNKIKIVLLLALGSAKANGREPKSCLGRVFNFKLGCFVMCVIAWPTQAQLSLELKTWPRFRPVSLSLSMTACIKSLFSQLQMNETRKDNLF